LPVTVRDENVPHREQVVYPRVVLSPNP
jgi:hypothetical protein